MKFLVVDDLPSMRKVVQRMLETMNIPNLEVVEAKDGLDALQKFDESFHFVITDWDMPNMEGPDLIRGIRSLPYSEHVRIIFASSRFEDYRGLPMGLEGMVNCYLPKPFDTFTFTHKVKELLPQ